MRSQTLTKDFVSLGDLFPEQGLLCGVRDCRHLSAYNLDDPQYKELAANDPALPDEICEKCLQWYQQASDRQLACAGTDCQNTKTWPRYQQLEAQVQGNPQPPPVLCEECRSKIKAMADRELPCRVKGCDRTWTWTARQQMTWHEDSPPSRLCNECHEMFKALRPRRIACRVKGCTDTWDWSVYQQLEYARAGRNPEQPPKRMCKACYERLQQLQDIQFPCKVSECERKWTWTAFSQLEHQLQTTADIDPEANATTAEPPARMCPECFAYYRNLRDIERPCRNRGCRHTWTYSRGWQLRDWLKGRNFAPTLMCQACTDRLQALTEKQAPCAVPGCTDTVPYTPEEQLKDQLGSRAEPRPRRCPKCEQFLAEHQTEAVPCTKCGASISWSAYEQLLCQRGTFQKPTACADCAGRELAEHVTVRPPVADHHHVVRMPTTGRWHSIPRLAAWPPYLDRDAIAKAEQADIRIVTLGDDLTYSMDDPTQAWPARLEQRLNEKLRDQALAVSVVNAGMPGTTSRDALVRLARDVRPFAPHLVIFSFALADSWLEPHRGRDGEWSGNLTVPQAEQAMENLCRELAQMPCKLLYWTTNPIFAQTYVASQPPGTLSGWADLLHSRKAHNLAHALHVCKKNNIPILDLRSRFEVNGEISARKWMRDWYNHNDTGAANITAWMMEYILREKLIPGLED